MEDLVDARWSSPFAMILAGPSGCGKTRFIMNLLRAASSSVGCLLDAGPVQQVVYCHSGASDPPSELKRLDIPVTANVGMCDSQWLKENTEPSDNAIVIFDDLAQSISRDTLHLFTVGRHHLSLNIVLVMHNLFDQNPLFRTLSLNTQYLVVFKNVRDRSSIKHLARQLYPESSRVLERVYQEAVQEPFGYLFIDLHQTTPEHLRLKTSVFFERTEFQGGCAVYKVK